jgi:hypothetical protein
MLYQKGMPLQTSRNFDQSHVVPEGNAAPNQPKFFLFHDPDLLVHALLDLFAQLGVELVGELGAGHVHAGEHGGESVGTSHGRGYGLPVFVDLAPDLGHAAA